MANLKSAIKNITKNWVLRKCDLQPLSKQNLQYLLARFPYTMALIVKHGSTQGAYGKRLKKSKFHDCFMCNKAIQVKERHEMINNDIVEYTCQACFVKRTDSKQINTLVLIRMLTEAIH